MKYLKLFFLLFVCVLVSPSCDNSLPDSEEADEGKTDGNELVDSDTIDYRALVFVEEGDLQSYGGERAFKNNLEKMFYNTTRFWNESPNKFKYYFRWIPAGVQTYKIDGERNKSSYDKQRSVTNDLDYSKYDFAVFFALGVKSGEGGLSCGGSSKGHKVVWAYIEEGHNIFTDAEYPNQGTYSNLGHEYGHVRGAQDLYQYIIPAERNKISGQAYEYPKCNMGTGYMVWSDYCSSLFNYDALMKQLPDKFDKEVFPEQVVIRVMQNGEPVNRATVRLWGTRAGGYFGGPEVYAKEPFLDNRKTNSDGEVVFTKVYEMYNRPTEISGGKTPPKSPKDEFPFSRWYCFLVEAEYGTSKGYAWLSDLDIVPDHLNNGNETYELVVNLK